MGIDKLPKPSVCDDYCKGCRHYNESYGANCEYMRDTGMRRPCPAGTGCTEHTKRNLEGFRVYARKDTKRKIDDKRGRELFKEGKSDKEIAAEFGVAESSIIKWRYKNGLLRQRGGARSNSGRNKEEEAKDDMKKKYHDRSVEDALIEEEDARAAGPASTVGSAEREFLARSAEEQAAERAAERALQESPVEPPVDTRPQAGVQSATEQSEALGAEQIKAKPGGNIRMEPRAEAEQSGTTGWTVNDFSMAHRCIGVIEGIAEGIVVNVGAKERLLQAARTLCELMEKARIDTAQEIC